MGMCLGSISRRPEQGDKYRDPIPLRDVLAFLGKEYVGNLNVRLARILRGSGAGARSVTDLLNHFKKIETQRRGVFNYNELIQKFSLRR